MSPVSSPAKQRIDALLALCVARQASDLHLSSELPPYLRVQGVLAPLEEAPVLTALDLEGFVTELARSANTDALTKTGSIDGATTASDGTRFRFNIFRRQGYYSIALRRLEERFRGLAELGLPEQLYEVCDLTDGLVLVAGPTGSGKSTTLATLLDRINRTRQCHIITIEDPIEYLHKPIKSLVNQRQIGTDASSFNDALVASLRQDPDVVLVGEIRDQNTIRTAITASETGHLVFATVHAGDCIGAIERLVSVFSADEQPSARRQLSLVLRWIVAQHLLVSDGPKAMGQLAPGARPQRVVTSEILRNTPAVANLIATAKSHQIMSSMEASNAQGMQTMEQDLARLMVAGTISETTALALARNAGVLRDWSQHLRQRAFGGFSGGGNTRSAGGKS